MAAKIEALEAKVLELEIEDRARLAGKLIISLDAPEEEENLRLWVAEAERRLQQLRDGKAKEIPARDVFRRARAALTLDILSRQSRVKAGRAVSPKPPRTARRAVPTDNLNVPVTTPFSPGAPGGWLT